MVIRNINSSVTPSINLKTSREAIRDLKRSPEEIKLSEKVELSREARELRNKYHFTKEERKVINYIRMATAEIGKDRCVYTEDPSKYIKPPLNLKVESHLTLLSSMLTLPMLLGSATLMIFGGGPLGVLAGLSAGLATLVLDNYLFSNADAVKREAEFKLMDYEKPEVRRKLLEDKGITPEEGILRLRQGKPIYVVVSLSPFKTLKLSSIEEALKVLAGKSQ